ncbi:hypothetical protein AVEN_116052-1 [Araneus ventricosus]|uniref:Uncharacterized protein n=1 Tax=Araneus ventricosus TaxID=182803 RepID=A0A4Y2P6M7_ARAVE|nr:hypothetical protein AVEN_116052-1 [Araneus ventricosus]
MAILHPRKKEISHGENGHEVSKRVLKQKEEEEVPSKPNVRKAPSYYLGRRVCKKPQIVAVTLIRRLRTRLRGTSGSVHFITGVSRKERVIKRPESGRWSRIAIDARNELGRFCFHPS